MESEPQIFDFVKLEKEKAIARFNYFRRIAKLPQFLELLLVLGLISWSSARAPPLLRAAAASAVQLSAHLFNHHVVFLIGNVIIFTLFLLCRRQSDAAAAPSSGVDFYDEYAKHRDAVAAVGIADGDLPPPSPIEGGAAVVEEEKQIVVCAEVSPHFDDDMAAAIDNARRQIKRFERTQSEKLKREIRLTTTRLWRSETQTRRKSVSCGGDAAEIERLSSEEFRRRIDAFIDENWSTKKTKINEYQKYQLLEMA